MTQKIGEASKDRLHRSINDLCEFGVKYAGTPGETKARDYLLKELNELGLENVRLEKFEYLNYMPKGGELEITSSDGSKIKCEPLQHSANDEVEGELVHAGNSEEEFRDLLSQGLSLDGKIALTKTPFPFFLYPLVEKHGGAGIVVVTDPPDNLIRAATGVNDRREGNIPGVTISAKDGQLLEKEMKSGKVKLRMKSQGTYSQKESWNVIGEITGTESPSDKITICSHYDSQIKGQHAWDNVSGDAGLLEITRLTSDPRPRRTIEVIFFGVEEQGPFWGSTSYLNKHEKEIKNSCHALINLDGFSSRLCPKNFLETTPQARDYALETAKKSGWPVHHVGDPMPLSDHVLFIQAGVPVIWIHEGLIDPYYHTEGDTQDHIDFKKLAKITEVAGLCVSQLANAERLPF